MIESLDAQMLADQSPLMDVGNIISFASLIVSMVALIGVFYARKSIKAARTWNGLLAASYFLDTSRFDTLLDKADQELERIGVQFEMPISVEDSQKILSDSTAEKHVMRLLTFMERTSAWINAGTIDDELAYQFMVGQITGVYRRFQNFIELRRQIKEDQEIMGELHSLANRWQVRKDQRKALKARVRAERRPEL